MLIALAMVAVMAPPAEGSIAIIPALPGDRATTYAWAFARAAKLSDSADARLA